MKDVSDDRKMSADNATGERSEVNTRCRVTRSSGGAAENVQNLRSLRKENIKTDKKTDKYIKDDKIEVKSSRCKGNCLKDPVSHATKLKQIFQEPCVLANKLDDFSSGCTPFRKVVEKRSKRKKTEVAPRPAKKPCLEKFSSIEDEQNALQTKRLEPDCGMNDAVKATSDVCDRKSAGNVTVNPVKSCMYTEGCGSGEIVVDLSGFKYPGRKRMMCESTETSDSDRDTLSEKTRKLQVNKKTSDEHRTDRKKLCETTDCADASMTSHERIELMHRKNGMNVETTEGVNGTAGDEELAASLQRREDEKIMEEQLTESKFIFCDICQKQLNHLSVQRRHLHVNSCTVEKEKAEARRQREATKANLATSHTLDCPMCGVRLKTAPSRTSHLKKCAAKYKISTSDLMTLVRRQENDPQELARVLNKNQSTLRGATNKRRVRNRRLDQPKSLDEGLQLAVALSTSLQEEQERQAREECIISETTDVVVSIEKPTIPDAFKVLMSPKKSKPAKRDRHKPLKAPSILTHSVEETQRRLMARVTSLVLPQAEEDTLTTSTGRQEYRDTQLGVTYTVVCSTANDPSVVSLWERGSHEGGVPVDPSLYYVSQLMPPVHPCLSSAGAKLKRMSCIPGWAAQDDKRMSLPSGTREASSLDQSAVQTSTLCCLPVTQTATVLCELAEEAGQSQLSHDDTVIEGDTGDVSHHPEAAGYCHEHQESRVDGATETLLGALAKMVNNPTLSDVTLRVQQGRELHAHKFMLIARCPRLLELFERGALSWLSDYKEEAMMAVLRFIYVGDVFVPPATVQQTHALAERLNLGDLAGVCKEIIESQGETPYSEMAAIRGDEKVPVDLDLQHMLKDIWGSDSEDSDDSSDGEKDAENEEEEMEKLYEYMSTQRQKLKVSHRHGNDNQAIDEDRKTAENVTDVQHSPQSCESSDVDATLKVSGVELTLHECSGNQHSPHEGVSTPRSVLTRSLSARTSPKSDLHMCRSGDETSTLEIQVLNTPKEIQVLNTPKSDTSTPRTDSGSASPSRNTPVLLSGSTSPQDKQRWSVTSDCSPTASFVRKDLFSSAQGRSPNTHSRSQTLAKGGSSKESTRDLNQSCVSPEWKSNDDRLCEDREEAHLSSPSDVTLPGVTKTDVTYSPGGDNVVQLHESLTETSTLENSGLDLFESFLADRSGVEPPSSPGGSPMHSGSTAAMGNPESESMEVEDESDSIGVLEYYEDPTSPSGMLANCEEQGDSVVVVEKVDSVVALDDESLHDSGVIHADGVREKSGDENDITEATDHRTNRTNPTALLVRLSSLLSENSSEDTASITPPINTHSDNPLTSPTIYRHGDGPLTAPPVCVHGDSLGSSCSGLHTSSVTPEREILSSPPRRRKPDKSLHVPQDQQYDVNVTSGSASVRTLREPPSVRRSAKLVSLKRKNGDRSGETETVVRDETSIYDTVDLTQDDGSEPSPATVTPPGGDSSQHGEDGGWSPTSSVTDGVLEMTSPQDLTQQAARSERRSRTPRRSREIVRETCTAWRTGEVEDLTREQLEDLTGDMEEDHLENLLEDPTGELMKDLSDDLVRDPVDPVNDLTDDRVDFIHDPAKDLIHDVSVELTQDHGLGHDPGVDPVEDLTGEDVDDSYYDPPTFMEDECSDLADETGRHSQGGRTPHRAFPQSSLQAGPASRRHPITPRPNLTTMETPELKAACHKIGVKPMPKKRMVKLLNHVYEETHGLTSENDCLPVIQNKAAKSKTAAAKRGQKKNLASDTAKMKCRKRMASAASSEDMGSGAIEDVMVDTRMSPPSSPLKGLSHKRQQIREFILSHEDTYLKMLHYEPLESEEFRKQLKDAGLNIGASVIMDFLDEQNIALTTRQTSGWRHKGAKQTKKRQP